MILKDLRSQRDAWSEVLNNPKKKKEILKDYTEDQINLLEKCFYSTILLSKEMKGMKIATEKIKKINQKTSELKNFILDNSNPRYKRKKKQKLNALIMKTDDFDFE